MPSIGGHLRCRAGMAETARLATALTAAVRATRPELTQGFRAVRPATRGSQGRTPNGHRPALPARAGARHPVEPTAPRAPPHSPPPHLAHQRLPAHRAIPRVAPAAPRGVLLAELTGSAESVLRCSIYCSIVGYRPMMLGSMARISLVRHPLAVATQRPRQGPISVAWPLGRIVRQLDIVAKFASNDPVPQLGNAQ